MKPEELADELEALRGDAHRGDTWNAVLLVRLAERLPAILSALRDGEKMRLTLTQTRSGSPGPVEGSGTSGSTAWGPELARATLTTIREKTDET